MKTDNESLAKEPKPKSYPLLRTSRIPHEVSARLLASSQRMSGKSRRLFMRSRDMIVDMPRAEHDEQATYCRSLKRLSMRQLGRRMAVMTRKMRALTAYLDDHELESFRRPALDELQLLSYRRGWLAQEIDLRTKKA